MKNSSQSMIDVAQDYLRSLDEGRANLLDLFTEDAEIYFPKFGVTKGRQHLLEMLGGFGGQVEYIRHDYATLNFLPSGDSLVVEGTSQGKLAGKTWEGGKTPGGRFCNVFRFRDGRISSLHIYLDPDYTGEDAPRFRWGSQRTW